MHLKSFARDVLAVIVGLGLVLGVAESSQKMHLRQVRRAAQAGLRQEIRENYEGVQELRAALTPEMGNISNVVEQLKAREAGRPTGGQAVHLGLAVMALTDANWRAASGTGALEWMDYESVERFAAAYFEQTRLAQLQTTTLDTMMGLESYAQSSADLAALTPEQACAAEVQARLLLAHLRTMARMSDGLQEAYKTALN